MVDATSTDMAMVGYAGRNNAGEYAWLFDESVTLRHVTRHITVE